MGMDQEKCLIVVPVHNNENVLPNVLTQLLEHQLNVLVVDDGSDTPVPDINVPVVRHSRCLGWGAAVLTGVKEASSQGYTHIVTVEIGGGQDLHEISGLLSAMSENPDSIIIGQRDSPNRNGLRFLRSFLGFWMRVQTGNKIVDIDSGLRVYPVQLLCSPGIWTRGLVFKNESLVRAAWAGSKIQEINVGCKRTPDTKTSIYQHVFLLSVLNMHLALRSIMPLPHRRLYSQEKPGEQISMFHPLRSIKRLVTENSTPGKIAMAVAMGIFLGTLPLFFVHTVVILFAANFLKLNKPAAVVASQFCMPPIVPALSIELGHLLRHGRFLTEISLQTLGYEVWDRFLEWILGAILLAPVLAAVAGVAAYLVAKRIGVKAVVPQADPTRRKIHDVRRDACT